MNFDRDNIRNEIESLAKSILAKKQLVKEWDTKLPEYRNGILKSLKDLFDCQRKGYIIVDKGKMLCLQRSSVYKDQINIDGIEPGGHEFKTYYTIKVLPTGQFLTPMSQNGENQIQFGELVSRIRLQLSQILEEFLE